MLRILRNVLIVIAALVLVLLAYVGIELARGPAESRPERVALELPVGPAPPPAPALEPGPRSEPGDEAVPGEAEETDAAEAEAPGELPLAAALLVEGPPLRVRISLEEGEFRIRRGGVGGVVRVEGTYDSAVYELSQEYEPDEVEGGLLTVKLRRNISAVRSLLTALRDDSPENHLVVELPAGLPLDLSLNLSKGEHEVDLTGLAVVRLDVDARMGEFEMLVGQPNPVEMVEAVVVAKMGEFELRGLGDANLRHLSYTGSMGDHVIDFGGAARVDTSAEVSISMGSGRVRVPGDRDFEIERRSSFLAELSTYRAGPRGGPEDPPPQEGLLTLDLSVRMGELLVR
jgi:hypothetical protein